MTTITCYMENCKHIETNEDWICSFCKLDSIEINSNGCCGNYEPKE